jgi:hypothetical protein
MLSEVEASKFAKESTLGYAQGDKNHNISVPLILQNIFVIYLKILLDKF